MCTLWLLFFHGENEVCVASMAEKGLQWRDVCGSGGS